MTEYKVGDVFKAEDFPEDEDCDATMPGGLPFCSLVDQHAGPHVATDSTLRVLAVWH